MISTASLLIGFAGVLFGASVSALTDNPPHLKAAAWLGALSALTSLLSILLVKVFRIHAERNFAAAYKSAQRHRGSCQRKRIFVRCAKRPPRRQKSCKSKVALLPSTDRVSLACATANDAVGSSDGTMGRSTLPEPQWRRWVSEQQPRRVRLDPIRFTASGRRRRQRYGFLTALSPWLIVWSPT